MKIAIIHEWLVTMGGSEKWVKAVTEIYPDADIFVLVAHKTMVKELGFENKKITTSIIQKLPFGIKKYKTYLPLFPFAVEQFDLRAYDLVISSNHAVSKGVLTSSNQLHITYCHSPIRYAWDLYHQYLEEEKLGFGLKGLIARYFLHRIRIWDFQSANRPDYITCNSNFIGARIKKVYGKEATTIYSGIKMDDFRLEINKENYYVTSSRMVPYKKIDIIVEAFTQMQDKKLIVIGDGPDMKKIAAKAGKNIEFKGYLPFDELVLHLQKAKAFVFAAIEDFGLLPVEAQACGTPVIALGKGGTLETVIDGQTGVLFHKQTAEAIMDAVSRFEIIADRLHPVLIRQHAEKFSSQRFSNEFKGFVDLKLTEKQLTQQNN